MFQKLFQMWIAQCNDIHSLWDNMEFYYVQTLPSFYPRITLPVPTVAYHHSSTVTPHTTPNYVLECQWKFIEAGEKQT